MRRFNFRVQLSRYQVLNWLFHNEDLRPDDPFSGFCDPLCDSRFRKRLWQKFVSRLPAFQLAANPVHPWIDEARRRRLPADQPSCPNFQMPIYAD